MKYFILLCVSLSLLTSCKEKAETKTDTMMVHDAQSFETATGMKVGAALFTLHNTGSEDDALVGVSSTASPRAEMHTMIDDNGIMRMRKVDEISVPAGGMTTLTPDGYHIMIMDLREPLKAGNSFDLTLEFKHAQSITVTVPIESRAALTETLNENETEHDHNKRK